MSGTTSRAKRRTTRVAAVGVASALVWLPMGVGLPAPASADAAYSSVVSAQNLHVTISNAAGSIPIAPQIDGGLGTAQAALDNNGQSSAYAASPDPGFIGTLPALAGSAIPVPLPVPFPSIDNPTIAATGNGQPPVTIGTAAYQLHAEADDDNALASSVLGGTADGTSGAGTSTARSSIVHDKDGTVTASAVSDSSALTVLGLVALGQVHAEAKIIRSPFGDLTRSSDLAIGRLRVAGLTVGYVNGRFTAAGTDAPVDPALINGLVQTASQGRVSLSETPAHQTHNGIVSAALNITQTVPAPPGGCVTLPLDLPILGGVTYCGETKIVYTVGGAVADTFYQAFPTATDLSGGFAGGLGTGTTVPGGTDTGALAGGPATAPDLSAPAAGAPPALAPAGPTDSAPAPSVAVPRRGLSLAGLISGQHGAADLYLALVAAGLLALGAVTAIRVLGVRNAWAA